jgi:hypothetical protein
MSSSSFLGASCHAARLNSDRFFGAGALLLGSLMGLRVACTVGTWSPWSPSLTSQSGGGVLGAGSVELAVQVGLTRSHLPALPNSAERWSVQSVHSQRTHLAALSAITVLSRRSAIGSAPLHPSPSTAIPPAILLGPGKFARRYQSRHVYQWREPSTRRRERLERPKRLLERDHRCPRHRQAQLRHRVQR